MRRDAPIVVGIVNERFLSMNDESNDSPGSNRREFLSGIAARKEIQKAGSRLVDEVTQKETPLQSGETVRLSTRAMACDFSVILNADGNRRGVISASDTLEIIHEIESELTVYRESSSLLELNQEAKSGPVSVEEELFSLLKQSLEIASETDGAFTPSARTLNQLWRRCRSESTPPEQEELKLAVEASNYQSVVVDPDNRTIRFQHPELGFDLSGIGKGYALDRASRHLIEEGVTDFLFHGGHSSILVRGNNADLPGWPVGIRHPLFQHKRLATILLTDCGFSSSGSGVQFFRHEGKKYGHLFDPRTGHPAEEMLSVTVLAPTAAIADALSTAFYVMPPEQTEEFCSKHPEIQAILIPPPTRGNKLKPIFIGLNENDIHWEK